MKTITRNISFTFAVLILGFFVVSRTTAPYGTSVLAQKGKETTTTVADNRYGRGGTHEITTDEKLKIINEVWKDQAGNVRERHSVDQTDLDNLEQWAFYKFDATQGKYVLVTFFAAEAEKKHYPRQWSLSGRGVYIALLDREGVQEKIEEIEKQFAKDGTIPNLSKETAKPEEKPKQETFIDTNVEQPTLPDRQVVREGKIDTCLIGTWRSESVVRPSRSGGSGIRMTVKSDGELAIDYTGMQDVKSNTILDLWSGSATGHISTNNSLITVVSVEKSAVTFKVTLNSNPPYTKTGPDPGLGGVFEDGGKVYKLNYTCDDTSLIIKAMLQDYNVDTFTFKREKKTP